YPRRAQRATRISNSSATRSTFRIANWSRERNGPVALAVMISTAITTAKYRRALMLRIRSHHRLSRWRAITLWPGSEIPNQTRSSVMLAPTPQNSKGLARKTALWSGVLAIAGIYLFATRPEPLVDSRTSERSVPIERVFRILAAENATMRALWTAEIVGAGTKAGLKFDEKWREPAVAAGPLPALFLRESATALQKNADPTRSVSRIRLSDRAIELVYRRAGQTF